MKLTLVTLLALAFLPLSSHAQNSAFYGLDIKNGASGIPAVRLLKPAEILAAEVTIVASSRESDEQAVAFNNTLQLFRAEVAKTPNAAIEQERSQQGGGAPSSLSSGRFATNRSGAGIRLTYVLTGGIDSAGAAQVLRALVARVKLPSDVAVKIEALRIEVRDADSLRDPLLKAIAEDSTRIQNLFKATPIHVTGLEHAVEQYPINDREVVVFIPYTLSIGGEKR